VRPLSEFASRLSRALCVRCSSLGRPADAEGVCASHLNNHLVKLVLELAPHRPLSLCALARACGMVPYTHLHAFSVLVLAPVVSRRLAE
jgi:hypothetical protein